MMRLVRTWIVSLAMCGACGSAAARESATTTPPADTSVADTVTTAVVVNLPSSTSVTDDRSLDLYTHCGVIGAMIGGVWWEAAPALSDGIGNPPDGWGNPYQTGELHFIDDSTATFTGQSESNGELVANLKRTASTEFPFICS